ncbi:3-carboxy-cis,cis-muconate cycloisomerase [Pollutimonas nitritireducens]|uniref:3-carboxy-cis,cis-muconate cycloisomerase n=1 Tax=Pollutimonas nitritireducens TaxID=2045209 RepID=A0A2N4UE94_9BURK|nr:adenylosuccinate lyase family protein [Pollutimonas nitritireducens]PLC53340.1 3-carboxy-cis,cis-muconate cycloisomerase [Pollutimonas nitritireducens]
MSISVLESAIFKDMFGTPEMRAVFDDAATVRRYVETEVALAVVQGRLGVIPEAAAQAIAASADASRIDMKMLKEQTEIVGYPILPLVHQLSKLCGPEGEYLHWGATTQDIMDTATVLQVRDALAIIDADLEQLDGLLASLSERYRDAPMAGRTHLQHALPITFGYKAAVWLLMIRRHRERLVQLKPRVLVGQFGGAAGTLASLGDDGLAVHAELMKELALGATPITWHVARDGLAEAVQFLGLVTASLGKIALDVMLMMTNELGEAYEPFVKGRGASSTMPQKRNPISCELMWSASKTVRQHAGLALDAIVQDFERATGPWHIEWSAIPEAFVLTAGSLHQAKFMLAGLEVDTQRMRHNLGISGGLIVAEAVMMGLAPHIGRQTAHDVVYDACRLAATEGRPLSEILHENPAVSSRLDRSTINGLCDPANYLGSAQKMVDRMRHFV